MKKYKNFIIMMIFSMLLGGIVGGLSGKNLNIEINFGKNIYLYLFRGFLGIEIILSIIIVSIIIFIIKRFRSINLDNIPSPIEKIIDILIHLSTTSVIISLTFMSIMINRTYSDYKSVYIIISFLTMLTTNTLQILSIRCYNKYHPDKKLNMFENHSNKKYFERLDEGEKWIAYISSYKSFKGMQLVYSAILVILMIFSVIATVPIILPLVIALLWIIQISIYCIEASKYN